MKDDYWTLFCITGEPVFYLLYRRGAEHKEKAKTAWCGNKAQLI